MGQSIEWEIAHSKTAFDLGTRIIGFDQAKAEGRQRLPRATFRAKREF
jgi:hypothetical protein